MDFVRNNRIANLIMVRKEAGSVKESQGVQGVLCTPSLSTKKGKWIDIQYLLSERGKEGVLGHGLMSYIDTKGKCRHLKNFPIKGLRGRCLHV